MNSGKGFISISDGRDELVIGRSNWLKLKNLGRLFNHGGRGKKKNHIPKSAVFRQIVFSTGES